MTRNSYDMTCVLSWNKNLKWNSLEYWFPVVLFQNDQDKATNFSYINIKVLSVFHTSCKSLSKQHSATSSCGWRKGIYRTADKEWSSSFGVRWGANTFSRYQLMMLRSRSQGLRFVDPLVFAQDMWWARVNAVTNFRSLMTYPNISWLAEHLLDSKDRLCSMQLLMFQTHEITIFHDVYQFLNINHIL